MVVAILLPLACINGHNQEDKISPSQAACIFKDKIVSRILQRYFQTQSQGHTMPLVVWGWVGGGTQKDGGQTGSPLKGNDSHCQSDQHWNHLWGNFGDKTLLPPWGNLFGSKKAQHKTSNGWHGMHMGFPIHLDLKLDTVLKLN